MKEQWFIVTAINLVELMSRGRLEITNDRQALSALRYQPAGMDAVLWKRDRPDAPPRILGMRVAGSITVVATGLDETMAVVTDRFDVGYPKQKPAAARPGDAMAVCPECEGKPFFVESGLPGTCPRCKGKNVVPVENVQPTRGAKGRFGGEGEVL